jgi:hypothetical protein
MTENARWGFDVSRGEPLVIALARSFLCAEKKIRSISSSVSKGGERGHGHEKVLKKPTSWQAMRPALEKQYTAPPPDVTRDKR